MTEHIVRQNILSQQILIEFVLVHRINRLVNDQITFALGREKGCMLVKLVTNATKLCRERANLLCVVQAGLTGS